MPNRNASATLVTVALATAIHLDWHVARPTVHHLSLGLPAHWLLAIPVFGLVAWYVVLAWPSNVLPASIAILAGAIILAKERKRASGNHCRISGTECASHSASLH